MSEHYKVEINISAATCCQRLQKSQQPKRASMHPFPESVCRLALASQIMTMDVRRNTVKSTAVVVIRNEKPSTQ